MKDLPDLQEDRSESGNPRSEFTTVYDIIDRIQAMLDEAKAPIFSPGLVKVDRDELADDLNELKKMLPVQLERASALMREAERRLNTAQTQANATMSDAQSRAADIVKEAGEQARFLAGQENVVAIARQKAQTIIDTAQAQADRLVQGADGYAAQVMGELDTQLGKMSQDVRAGLEVLHQREQEAARSMNASVSDQGKETQG
ncbi:cell division protein [Bifidobacterium asteroides]|nr:cell division protein [Bifidobacterium asteroides]